MIFLSSVAATLVFFRPQWRHNPYKYFDFPTEVDIILQFVMRRTFQLYNPTSQVLTMLLATQI